MTHHMLVQVTYGEHHDLSKPLKGYTYDDRGLGVQLGDFVLVPSTWLGEVRGEGRGNGQIATVCALESDYNGHVVSIIRIVETAKERKARTRRDKRLATAYRRAAKHLGDEHPEAVELLKSTAAGLASSR